MRPFIAVIPAAGPDPTYDGEWAGPWETALVKQIVPWVDANLPTIATPAGRVLAGLSAGGYGAFDIALRHPSLFGAVESWSGYFTPLRDGPFTHADAATLAANNPTLLARTEAAVLRRAGTRFFVSTGPFHSHWIPRGTTQTFARELHGLGLPVELRVYPDRVGEWRDQLDAGLNWAFPA
jgi:enterochelin esterase-like enzyme